MLDFDIVAPTSRVIAAPYVVRCWKCEKQFNVESATWCTCDSKLRTLQCPLCTSCFCQASFGCKRNFWNGAPQTLRANPNRFRIAPQRLSEPDAESHASAPDVVHQPHVLIVDDEEPIRSLAACYVEQLGYQVTTACCAEEAILLTEQVSFDVVLTDALMPKIDGRELCRRLKSAHGPRIKVVVMTALYTARRFQTEARTIFKVDGYLAKPLHYEALRDALHHLAPLVRVDASHAILAADHGQSISDIHAASAA